MRLDRHAIAFALLALASIPALAEEETCDAGCPPSIEDMSLVQLERIFWICDHAATVSRVPATSASYCTAVTIELRKQKFGGDYHQLLAWWRDHKVAEYEKLDGVSQP